MKDCVFFFGEGPLVREAIYRMFNDNLDCKFVFCDGVNSNLKTMDYSLLSDCVVCGRQKKLLGMYYRRHLAKSGVFKTRNIIMAGNARDLSMWYILVMCKLFHRNIKTFIWGHGFYGRESWLQRKIKQLKFSLSDYVLLYGDYAKGLILKNNLAKESKLKVIYNSLDYDTQTALRRDLEATTEHREIYRTHFGNDNPVLVFLGRLTYRKQLALFIEAAAKLNNAGIAVNVVLVGTGEDEDNLKKLVEQRNIVDKVWFYGESYDEKRNAELLYNADICVSPGDVGLTAMHSFIFGCPVITHNRFQNQMPEYEIIEENKTGAFFEYGSVNDLCEKIERFLIYERNNREQIRQECYRPMDERFNPHYQFELISGLLN